MKSASQKVSRVSASTRNLIANLVIGHKAIIVLLRENILAIDEDSEDVDVVYFMINFLQRHEKMLRSLR